MTTVEQPLPTMVLDPSPVLQHQPKGWELRKEGARLASGPMKITLSEFLAPSENYVPGTEMLERSERQVEDLGPLASQYHAEALEALPADQILVEWRQFALVFLDTDWQDSDGVRQVVYLDWGGGGWVLGFDYLDSGWDASVRVVRVSQVP